MRIIILMILLILCGCSDFNANYSGESVQSNDMRFWSYGQKSAFKRMIKEK